MPSSTNTIQTGIHLDESVEVDALVVPSGELVVKHDEIEDVKPILV
ncbi:hypothetical protein ACVBAX_13310 [Robertmurraya sp. GLU-23]